MRPTPSESGARPRGVRRGELVGLVLALGALAVGFLVLADAVREQATQGFDEGVLRALRQPNAPAHPRGPPWIAETARDVTALGSVSVLTLMVVAVCGFLGLVRRWRTLALVLGATLGGGVVKIGRAHV